MKNLWQRLLELWQGRSARERVLLGTALAVVAWTTVQLAIAAPLRSKLAAARLEVERLDAQQIQALRDAGDSIRLERQLQRVEARIAASAKANLFTLLESLADRAGVKDHLDSIKPREPAGNRAFPETRVEVTLKGATLEQVIHLLYSIETAPLHLIVRSLALRTQPGKDATLLDVRFSVSSFERA
ncbi:MAG: GspMb/PilO family protein [Myxococcota bacterium]